MMDDVRDCSGRSLRAHNRFSHRAYKSFENTRHLHCGGSTVMDVRRQLRICNEATEEM